MHGSHFILGLDFSYAIHLIYRRIRVVGYIGEIHIIGLVQILALVTGCHWQHVSEVIGSFVLSDDLL